MTIAGLVLAAHCCPVSGADFEARITVLADQPGAVIDPNIYGQFVEHLGRGVYEGIWVGTGSSIPNTRGIRNDVVAALRHVHVPLVRWPGGCFAETYHLARRDRSARDAAARREHRLGRRGRDQPVRQP
jgi:alpha-N-arabinofuranosidase